MSNKPLYRIELQRAAEKAMARLPRNLRRRLEEAIYGLANNPRPYGYKQMEGNKDFYRIRVGDWRIIYRINDDVLVVIVVRIGSRGDVYRSPLT